MLYESYLFYYLNDNCLKKNLIMYIILDVF